MTTMRIEMVILRSLLQNEPYTRKVLPYLKKEFFQEIPERILFDEIQKYIQRYGILPKAETLHLAVSDRSDVFEDDFKKATILIDEIAKDKTESPIKWLIDETEKFCKDRSVHNALLDSIQILDGKDKKLDKGAIPKLLADALSLSFDQTIGHDFLEDSSKRYEFYHARQNRIPFDLDYFNRITGGGLSPKTLFCILAGVNVGKSLIMCHMAAAALMQHKNVLYITLELSEEKIAQRIEANLLDIKMDDLLMLPKDIYDKRIENLKQHTKGKLIVREYPTSTANVNHFRALLNELFVKKQFKPDLIFVDYINLCSSARYNLGQAGSYTYIKAIAEELRGLSVEFVVPVVTGTQLNREGFTNSDPDMTNTAESWGLPQTADVMVVVTTNEELEKLGQYMVKQLRNRDNDVTRNKRFVVGVDRPKMRIFDVAQDQQTLVDSGQDKQPTNNSYDKFKGVFED